MATIKEDVIDKRINMTTKTNKMDMVILVTV